MRICLKCQQIHNDDIDVCYCGEPTVEIKPKDNKHKSAEIKAAANAIKENIEKRNRYFGLIVVSYVLRFFSILTLVITLLLALSAIRGASDIYMGNRIMASQIFSMGFVLGTGTLIATILFMFSGLIRLLIDIENNTRNSKRE